MEPIDTKEIGPNEQSPDTTTNSQPQSSSSLVSEELKAALTEAEAKECEPNTRKRKGRTPTAEQKSKLSDIQKKRVARIKALCKYYGIDYPTAAIRLQELEREGKLDEIIALAQAGEEHASKSQIKCPRCGRTVIRRDGRFGPFLGCVGYPECRYTSPVPDSNVKPTEEQAQENMQKMQLTTKFIQEIGGTEEALKWIGIAIRGLTGILK